MLSKRPGDGGWVCGLIKVSNGNAFGQRYGTYVFADDLVQSLLKYRPVENLDIFLDNSRLWLGKSHNELEEVLALGFTFRCSVWLVALQIATNAVLLVDAKLISNQ